jgi:hypothetical protein
LPNKLSLPGILFTPGTALNKSRYVDNLAIGDFIPINSKMFLMVLSVSPVYIRSAENYLPQFCFLKPLNYIFAHCLLIVGNIQTPAETHK